jgi:hypothetical protein
MTTYQHKTVGTMSKLISELLGATEPMFSIAIKQLEIASGNPAADVRLTAEIIGKVHLKCQEMGLDPNDSTGAEIYEALKNKARIHDEHLCKLIGGHEPDDVATLLPLIKKAVDAADVQRDCWVLKYAVAKEMLRKSPPPKIMAHLGYDNVDAMLEHEQLAEIYGALRFAEGPEWLNEFDETYKTLTPDDFETRNIEIVMMNKERWGTIAESFVHKKRHNITHLKELGVILMLPVTLDRLPGVTITCMPLLFHYLNEIRLYSAFFKLKRTQSNFGEVFVNTLIADVGSAAVMAGQNIHWRVIQRYFGKLEKEFHPEVFEPHVQPEDLHWRSAEECLYKIDSKLEFWKDMDYVAVNHAGRPVPFNLMDVAVGYCNDTSYHDRVVYHFRESLWNEVFVRYMGEKTLREQVLKQLDNAQIAPELLAQHKASRGK